MTFYPRNHRTYCHVPLSPVERAPRRPMTYWQIALLSVAVGIATVAAFLLSIPLP